VAEVDQPSNNEASNRRHPNWGGKRPGAGAPKGNLNAFRHGKNSRYHQQLAGFLAQVPAAQEAMVRLARRRRQREREVQSGAAELMAEICRRIGEAVLDPENNHLENNGNYPIAVQDDLQS
jgi:hypothetical protein